MRTVRMAIAIGVLIALGRSSSAQGAVHVVDDAPGPGVDFTSLQAAVDAAAEGDTLLVKAGTYGQTSIDGKSLVIAADAPAGNVVTSWIHIRNLLAGQRVVLRGIQMSVWTDGKWYEGQLWIQASAGVVWVEDCVVKGGFNQPGVHVESSAAVVLLRSRFEGGTSYYALFSSSNGGPGARFANSAVHAFQCVFQGGDAHAFLWPATSVIGGDGATIYGGILFAVGSSFIGGPSVPEPGCLASWGGVGLILWESWPATSPPTAHTLDCSFQGGAASSACTSSAPGATVVVVAGTHTILTGTPCGLTASSPIREGQNLALQLDGEPGSIAALVIGLAPGASFLPSFLGSLLLDVPFAVIGTLVLPVSGAAALSLPFGSLPAGLESQSFYGQLGLLTPGLQIQACAGSALLVLDQQF